MENHSAAAKNDQPAMYSNFEDPLHAILTAVSLTQLRSKDQEVWKTAQRILTSGKR